MKRKTLSPLLCTLSILFPCLVQGVSDEQFQRIRELGSLNGVALQCRYLGETRRMKEALIKTLPRRRELGMAFDQITNESFLGFMERNNTCPNETAFSDSVDRAISSLAEAFPREKAE